MSRRKRATERPNHDRWLVSYADLITLLFAFFVVLYSTTQMDNKKVARIAAAIQSAFRQLGVFSGNAPLPSESAETPLSAIVQSANPENVRSEVKLMEAAPRPRADAYSRAGINVDELNRELKKALGKELDKQEVDMRLQPDGLVISLRENGFFKSGDTTLLPGAQATLTRIAKILSDHGYEIRVEGHTDNKPIRSTRFQSNWELSAARATEVVLLLIDRYGFDPRKISVAGYSEYRPIASNDSEEGRRMNRRVDLVVVAMAPREGPAPPASPAP